MSKLDDICAMYRHREAVLAKAAMSAKPRSTVELRSFGSTDHRFAAAVEAVEADLVRAARAPGPEPYTLESRKWRDCKPGYGQTPMEVPAQVRLRPGHREARFADDGPARVWNDQIGCWVVYQR